MKRKRNKEGRSNKNMINKEFSCGIAANGEVVQKPRPKKSLA